MLFLDFVKWWYGPGWLLRLKMLQTHLRNMSEFFSVGTLLKTIFSPWRQNVSHTLKDQTIGDRFNALLDNMISRLVGFVVRLIVFVVAIITLVIVLILNVIYVVVWPLIPLAPIILFATGASL